MTTFRSEPERRTREQNRRFWSALTDISRQVLWPVDGERVKLSPEDWKTLLTAALAGHQRQAMGIEGGIVLLGVPTSRMDKAQFADLIDLAYAFGSDHGVVWRDPTGRHPPDSIYGGHHDQAR